MSLFKGSVENQKCIKDTPFELSLNDCLACSGCVTDAEAFKTVDLSFASDSATSTSFVISPQSKVSLFNAFKGDVDYDAFENMLCAFLKMRFNVFKIVDTSYMRPRIYDSIHKEYMNSSHLITSACPGTVMYIEKTAPHLVKYLSRTKSPQQMAFSLVRGTRTVSVMPCYDKKLENGRDDVQFDHILVTKDFHRVLDDLGFQEFVATEKQAGELSPWEQTQWNIGSSAGGYAEFICSRGSFTRRTVRKGIEEYLGGGNVVLQITGLENSMNFFKSSKANGPGCRMAEIFLCPGSCIAGPGQIQTNAAGADAAAYGRIGKEQPSTVYAGIENERAFQEVRVKKKDFKVDW